MVFMGRGFTSGRQESGSLFSAAVGKIQASKCYIESLPLVLKDKRSCFSSSEGSTVQLPLDCAFALWPLDTFGNHQQPITYIQQISFQAGVVLV